ncbi:MAG: hypothetical protein NTZ49_00060 [Candidatus Parcubacteria bacterium]|nr:hypothetical protein [Candidatus Parcubacteria bacterium]
MKLKLIRKITLPILIVSLIIFSTGLLGHGIFWGIKTAFGYGGGGGGYYPPVNTNTNTNVNANTNINQPIQVLAPTIDAFSSPTGNSILVLHGGRDANTIVFINNSDNSVSYPTATTWQATVSLEIGLNFFTLTAKNSIGTSSGAVAIFVTRTGSADITGDNITDDLDLAKLVSNWNKNWSDGDYNKDGIIDDLDLAYLVSHWSI